MWERCDGRLSIKDIARELELERDVVVGARGVPWLEHGTLDVALGMLDAQIRTFIAANARDRIFVHAGVVARDGRALVIPGESFTGKTTLVSALVEAGATYYSDEYAVLDHDGRVHPYRRRLSIRSNDGTPTQERHVTDPGGVAPQDCAELAVVVVTRYRRSVEWQPKRLSPERERWRCSPTPSLHRSAR